MRFLENIQQPYGELNSAAELFRKQSSFYEKPQFSRRLVKRLVGRRYFLLLLRLAVPKVVGFFLLEPNRHISIRRYQPPEG